MQCADISDDTLHCFSIKAQVASGTVCHMRLYSPDMTLYSAYDASVVSVTVKRQSDHTRVCQAKTLMPVWISLDLCKNSHATLYIQGLYLII